MLAILPSASILVSPRLVADRPVPAKQSHLREVASTKMAFFQFPANFPGVHPKSETRKIRDSSP
jgi:hypothetical protein